MSRRRLLTCVRGKWVWLETVMRARYCLLFVSNDLGELFITNKKKKRKNTDRLNVYYFVFLMVHRKIRTSKQVVNVAVSRQWPVSVLGRRYIQAQVLYAITVRSVFNGQNRYRRRTRVYVFRWKGIVSDNKKRPTIRPNSLYKNKRCTSYRRIIRVVGVFSPGSRRSIN